MIQQTKEEAFFMERREEVKLTNTMLDAECLNELREIDKHEIIIKICESIGHHPKNLAVAEKIFDNIKFDITRYIMHHEYSKENSIRRRLLIWLDSKVYPSKVNKLSSFVDKYLK